MTSRVQVSLRLTDRGVAFVDRRARRASVGRSEVMRWMLLYAAENMPEEWRPVVGDDFPILLPELIP